MKTSARSFAVLAVMAVNHFAQAAPDPAACLIQTSAHLGEYRLSSGARGLISIQVRCPETGRYVLRFEEGGARLSGPSSTLKFAPTSGNGLSAAVEVQGLPDTVFNGTQRFDLTLWVAPGQWSLSGGQYQTDLAISAEDLGAGALP